MKIFISIISIIASLSFTKVEAHSPSNLSYELAGNQMKVYLTQQTVFDLLEHIYPSLKNQETIRFSDYKDDLERYFNENIDLEIAESPIALILEEMNLTGHESSLTFNLDGHPYNPNLSLQMRNTVLVGVYKDVSNTIVLHEGRDKRRIFKLDRGKNVLSINGTTHQKSIVSTSTLIFAGLIIVSLGFKFTRRLVQFYILRR